jgi:hypothetical protein
LRLRPGFTQLQIARHAPARCWAYCSLARKEGARKGHVVAASIRRDHEGQGRTHHLLAKETHRAYKKQQGIGVEVSWPLQEIVS